MDRAMGLLAWLFGFKNKKAKIPINLDGPGSFSMNAVGESHYQENLLKIAGDYSEDGVEIDVLAKLRESCSRYGLKLALYFSEGDWNWPGASDGKGYREGTGINPEIKKAQLKELCTRYGPIEFFWMDHAAGDGGLSHRETVDWIHRFQPDCFVGFNHGAPAGRLSLREMGKPGPVGDSSATRYNKEAEADYNGYLVAEFTYPLLPPHEGGAMWFYSLPEHDSLCLPATKIFEDYLGAMKYGNIFSLNIGPDYSGRIRDVDVATLSTVGALIRQYKLDGTYRLRSN